MRCDFLLGHKAVEIIEEVKEKPEVVIEIEPEKTIEKFKEEVFKKEALEFIEKTKPKKKKNK